MSVRPFKSVLEQKLGKFPQLLIYAVLEWIMIILLFIDGLLAFVSNEFANYFDLRIPCLLCTRIDHLLVQRNSSFYYNDSICETHKKGISSLAYCHTHKNLSDIRNMCQGCLVSFTATNKDCDFERYKLFIKDDKEASGDYKEMLKCSCCGESLKSKASSIFEDDPYQGKEDAKSLDSKEPNEDAIRTPRFARANKFFRLPLNSAPASPKWVNRSIRKISLDRGEFVIEPIDANALTELYTELDEERNASNVAANNAMAMITRLQAEKAAVQMEALQYQRMMEEQAEYDEEAFQALKDMLEKRDGDVKALETELDMYKKNYGLIEKDSSEFCEVDHDEYYQDRKSHSFPSFGDDSDIGSFNGGDQNESEHAYERYMENGRENEDEMSLGFEDERSHLLRLLTDLEKKLCADDGWNRSVVDTIKDEDESEGNNNKVTLTREVSSIKERLRAVEADSSFLKHSAMTLQKGNEGTELLTEIAQHLRKIRQAMIAPSDNNVET